MQARPELSNLLDAITSGDPRSLRAAIDQFSSEHRDDGFAIAEPLLSSTDATYRLVGVEALAGNTTEAALRWLADHAENDPSSEVRLEILRQLDDVATEDSRGLLLRKAADPDRRVRQLVASGLRHYADDEVTRALARFLVDDDLYVQERAIESLAACPRNGSSYLLHLFIPLWDGTYWDSITRAHANAEGDRRLVEVMTASFRQTLLQRLSPTLPALRWISLVDPEAVLLFAEERLRGGAREEVLASVRALSELLRTSEQLGQSRKLIQERCIALLRVISEREDRPDASDEARLLLERWSS